jgi:5-methylcytosine-specific restriction enzyme subunit McrC
VADAKYKLEYSAGRYPNADHYQMLAYCTALEVPIAWLVYAQGLAA